MLLSLIFSLIVRKKHLLFWSLVAILGCNIIYFSASIQKHHFLQKYTKSIPQFSDNDIFIVSNDTSDILHPKSFTFPYLENINNHNDVLAVAELSTMENEFFKANENPQLLVISLKKDSNSKKWIDTFAKKGEFIAIHSSQYRHMYNKAVIARNEALRTHFSLLSLISLTAFIGIIVFTAILPIKLYKEMMIVFLEGINFIKSIGCFGLCFAGVSFIGSFFTLSFSVFFTNSTDLVLRLFIQSLSAANLTAFFITAVTLFIGRRNYVKNKIL